MKINFIIPFKRMSGGIRVVYIYANYLTAKGHDVCCYLPMISYKGKDQSMLFRAKASLSNTIKKETWFDCNFPVKVVPAINNTFIRDADVVIATAWQTAYDVKKLNDCKGKKFYFVQDYETFNGSVKEVEQTYNLNIPIITINNELKSYINNFTKQVYVVYNGLFNSEYIYTSKPTSDKFRIIFMYHESAHKGSNEAIEVIKYLQNKYSDIEVTVFGRKIDCQFPDNFKVLINPAREQLLNAYKESDVYLFTSTIEAWGLPIIEAMANRCAVIGRKLGALLELYDGDNAVIIKDTNEMKEQLEFFYINRHRLKEIQNNGFDTVKQLGWDNLAEKFEKIIMK